MIFRTPLLRLHILVFLLLVFGTGLSATDYKSLQNHRPLSQKISNVPAFSKLTVTGNVTVILMPNSSWRGMTIGQNGQALYKAVDGTELILGNQAVVEKNAKGTEQMVWLPVRLTISGYPVAAIETHDNAKVLANHWQAHAPLDIRADGNSTINLQGTIHLAQVDLSDNARLYTSWVNSHDLFFHASQNAYAEFSGVTGRLLAKLENDAKLDAKYLRANDLHVCTWGQAEAKVTPLGKFAGFAYGNSHVLYYKTPGHLLDITAESGNVLQMEYWN